MRQLLFLLLLIAGLSGVLRAEVAVEEKFGGKPLPRVGYLPIEGDIDTAKAAYFKRSLETAQERKLTHLVVHMTTPGGELGAGMEMLNAALTVPKDAPRLIAFVDDHSLSAGSLIAYGHDEILVTGKAMLGDIGVVTMSEGKIEYLPEKVETVVRALLRNAAQNRGWDQAKLVKMTARTQELYRFDLEGGKQVHVIEDDLGTFLAAHPEVKSESKILILGEDRLLSYTAREAVDHGMATDLVADLAAVYARLNVAKSDVIDLSPSETERLSWTLASFAPLLAAAALLFLFLEFKMPLGGLWLALAALAGVGFFVCQFYLGLSTYVEVVLIVVGLLLIAVELFVLPTGGLIAIGGALVAVIGLVLAFMPTASQFSPSVEGWGLLLNQALVQSLTAIGVLSVGTVVAIQALPKMAVRTGLADAASIDGTSAGVGERQAQDLIGHTGTVTAVLRPGGQIEVDGGTWGAVSDHGEFLQPGARVVVVGVRFGELVVRPAPSPPESSASIREESAPMDPFIIYAVGIIFALSVFWWLIGSNLMLYIQSVASNAPVGIFTIIFMRIRKVNPQVIVNARITAKKAGIEVPADKLEAHFLAGGHVVRVINALIAANKAAIPLSFDRSCAIDLAGRDVLDAVQTSVNPKVIDVPAGNSGRSTIDGIAGDGIQLKVKARVTVRTNLDRLVGGATEETIVARVGEGIVTTIGSSANHMVVLENPDRISKTVLGRGLDAGSAFEILSIDIADIDVGDNIGARLRTDKAEADKKVAQAEAERQRAMAVAREQEMIALVAENRAKVVLAEAEIPLAMAEAFRKGQFGIMDYYQMKNVMADTEMRHSIAHPPEGKK